MSADDGYILRKNSQGKFVLQHYIGEIIPDPENPHPGEIFETLDDAVLAYQKLSESVDTVSEHGLSVHIGGNDKTAEEKEDPRKMKTGKFVRKPFEVEAVQVTSENIEDVARWCDGTIERAGQEGRDDRYINVRVHYPLSPRQTKAFIGDWVLYAGKGYKVYNPKAFENNFQPSE